MPFTDSEIVQHSALIEREFWSKRRPPLEIRDQMREGQRFEGLSVELFFVRPLFSDPSREVEESIAKVKFVRAREVWRIHWKRADGKWHGYKPRLDVGSLTLALQVIHEDAHGCFFG